MYFIIVPDIPIADHDDDDVKKKMEVVGPNLNLVTLTLP